MNEQVLRPAWRNYWFRLTAAGLMLLTAAGVPLYAQTQQMRMTYATALALGLLVLALGLFATAAFQIYSQKFSIDDKCIAQTNGLVSRNQLSIRLNDIRSIELKQSLVQRIFGVGDLAFYSAGTDSPEIKFAGITQPLAWKAKIDNARDKPTPD